MGSGAWFALTAGQFAMTSVPVSVALGIVTVLSVLGFGVLIPREVRIYLETTAEAPDRELIGDIGLRNAKLAGMQGAFQLAIIAVMVYIRFGYV